MRPRIFVFGSNLQGIHGGGAALFAAIHYGASELVPEGLSGDSYALPTCSAPGQPMSVACIASYVRNFVVFAKEHPELDFLVTAVGCGIAGHAPGAILPLFEGAPDNVFFQSKLTGVN